MGTGSNPTIGYKYKVGLLMVAALGEIDEVVEFIYADRLAWTGSITEDTDDVYIDKPDLLGGEKQEGGIQGYVDVRLGSDINDRNAYLVGQIGEDVSAFRGLFHLVFKQMYWTSMSPYIKKFAVRARKYHKKHDWYLEKRQIGVDMNVAHIVRIVLTEQRTGLGKPESKLNDASFVAFADRCYSEGMGLSIRWGDDSGDVEAFIEQLKAHADFFLYEHPQTGKYEVATSRDEYDVETIPEITKSNSKLVSLTDSSFGLNTPNEVTVIYRDRNNQEQPVTLPNKANILRQGRKINKTVKLLGVRTAELASRICHRILQAESVPAKTLTVRVFPSVGVNILPGKAFKYSNARFGLSNVVFRSIDVRRGNIGDGMMTISAVQDVFHLPGTEIVANQPSLFVNPVGAPVDLDDVMVQEASYWEVNQNFAPYEIAEFGDGFGFLMAYAGRSAVHAFNFSIATTTGSDTLANYTVGSVGDFSPTVELTADVDREQTTLPVSGANALVELTLPHLAYMGSEALAITAVDAQAGEIGVKRAVLDTHPEEHSNGDKLFAVGRFFGLEKTERVDAEVVFARLLPQTGVGRLPIASASTHQLTMADRYARPYPPANIKINDEYFPDAIIGDFTATWAHRDRTLQLGTYYGWTEDSIGPEPGTTYAVIVRIAATDLALQSHAEIASNSQEITALAFSGPVKVQLYAQRDDLASWQMFEHSMKYIPGPIVVTDTSNIFEPIENGTPVTIDYDAAPGQAPFVWAVSAGSAPNGLAMDAGTGELAGTPTDDGVYDFTVRAEDAQGFFGAEDFQIEVTSLPMILGGEAPDGELLTDYLFEPYTINVDAPITWSVISGSLPDGVTVDAGTGVVSGAVSPTEKGDFTFELEANGSAIATREYTINISGSVGRYFPHLYDGTEFIMSVRVELPPSMGGGVENWITHSTDADTWTLEQETVADGIRTMVYGLGKYVAQGGPFGNVISMADAVDEEWTTESVDSDVIDGLLFDGSRFVVSGEKGIILTRTDVTGWSEVTPHDLENAGELTIRSMVWDGTYYFCSARETVPSNPDLHQVWRSTDLITWTKQFEIDATDGVITRVQMANGLLFICGSQTIPAEPALRPWLMASSDDGGTWTDYSPTTVGSFAMPINDIVYFDGLYVLLAYNLNAYASTLGTWTTNEPTGGELNDRPVTDGTTLIAWRQLGGSENQLVKTTDGMAWTVFEP